jgi:HupE / UreJ protein
MRGMSEVACSRASRNARSLARASTNGTMPHASRRVALLGDYARLGLLHIFGGVDHLLFLAALALSVRKLRAVLVAETAFTASHSLTLTARGAGAFFFCQRLSTLLAHVA